MIRPDVEHRLKSALRVLDKDQYAIPVSWRQLAADIAEVMETARDASTKQTSSRVSHTAAKLLGMSDQKMMEYQDRYNDVFIEEVRSLAASALSQDETPS